MANYDSALDASLHNLPKPCRTARAWADVDLLMTRAMQSDMESCYCIVMGLSVLCFNHWVGTKT